MKILALILGIIFSFFAIYPIIGKFLYPLRAQSFIGPIEIFFIVMAINCFYLYDLKERHPDKSATIPGLILAIAIFIIIVLTIYAFMMFGVH